MPKLFIFFFFSGFFFLRHYHSSSGPNITGVLTTFFLLFSPPPPSPSASLSLQSLYPWLFWNLVRRPGWPCTHRDQPVVLGLKASATLVSGLIFKAELRFHFSSSYSLKFLCPLSHFLSIARLEQHRLHSENSIKSPGSKT